MNSVAWLIPEIISRLFHPSRELFAESDSAEDVDAFIDSRVLEYATKLEDEFVEQALHLGVESGMILDVGTRVGLIALKMLWHNENFYSIGVDTSGLMIDRARDTANAWGLGERAFFQVGDARHMRFKTAYFDIVVSDGVLHRYDDPVSVLAEIRRVLKPKGALLIRDFRRPNRFRMMRHIAAYGARYGARMRDQIRKAIRSAYTRYELERILRASGIDGARVFEPDNAHLAIQREGVTDPNSWIAAREQYR
jgi:ubiquinone/menaquinone biosynthesis C-methylase UbiE